jgi:lysophospholipase L1-like esterase
MLVLGDSVMWGQGLREEHKFSYMVRDWLCEKRNGGQCVDASDVQIHVQAHSGATIAKDHSRDDLFLRATSPREYPGEVNYSNPTIRAQVTLAERRYAAESIPAGEVDLILLNGGINDMSASKLIIPRPFARSVKDEAIEYCRDKMKDLLGDVVAKFPNARLLIPSYFPLVSEETPWDTVLDILLMAFPHQPQVARALFNADESMAVRRSLGVSDNIRHPIRHYLANRSRAWVGASNDALRDAVAWVNTTKSLGGRQRAWFVEVPFGPEHAYGTPTTYLWRLTHNQQRVDCAGRSIAQNVQSNDELSDKRACMCDKADKTNDLFCLRAGFMHPNTDGAKAYRDAIASVLESSVLPQADWV